MNPRSFGLFVVLGLALATPQLSQGAVVFYSDIVSFNAASNTALVEDFEGPGLVTDTALAFFVSNGNTYTGISSTPAAANVWVATPPYNNFGVNPTTSSILTATGDENFKVDFGSPSTAIGFDTYLNGQEPAMVQVFGAGGLLDTFNFNPATDPTVIGFLGITSSEAITSIQWTTTDGRRTNTGIDNILQGTAVPEPTTLLLLGLGLAGLGFSKRRLT